METQVLNRNEKEGTGKLMKYLTFLIDDTIYGLEIERVLDIIRIQEITSFPSQPDYVKGLINLRGKIVPTLDIRMKFNKPVKSYDDRTCIIVLEEDEYVVGVVVDTIREVQNIYEKEISLVDGKNVYYSNEYTKGIANLEDYSIVLLKSEKILERL